MDSIEAIIADMNALIDKYEAIGGGHAAQPVRNFVNRLVALLPPEEEREDYHDAIPGTDTLLRYKDKSYRCRCGANVFSKTKDPDYFRCNGCDAGYITGSSLEQSTPGDDGCPNF